MPGNSWQGKVFHLLPAKIRRIVAVERHPSVFLLMKTSGWSLMLVLAMEILVKAVRLDSAQTLARRVVVMMIVKATIPVKPASALWRRSRHQAITKPVKRIQIAVPSTIRVSTESVLR